MRQVLSFGLGVLIAGGVFAAEPARLGAGPKPFDPSTEPSTAPVPENDQGRVVSPFWNRPLDGEFPAADIRAVPPAAARATEARWVHIQLTNDLRLAARMLSMELESKPEYKKAVAAEAEAWQAMQAARGQALSGLQNNDAYLAGESLRQQLTEQIKDLYFEEESPDEERIIAMARLKLSYVSDNRRLEVDALARDKSFQDARQKYVAAAQRVRELREANALTVAMDDSLIALRRGVAETRIAKLSAQSYLKSARYARDYATNYAAYYRSVDRYRPYAYNGWYELGGYYPTQYSGYYR